MKNLKFIGLVALLLSSSSIISSSAHTNLSGEELSGNKILLPVEKEASSTNHVDYSVSNKKCDTNSTVNFTVSWQYTGSLTRPDIAYVVKIGTSDGREITSFLDTARGQISGSKDYSIKLTTSDTCESVVITVSGSDGGYNR